MLIAAQDGYLQSGFNSLALTSFARHFSQGFALALTGLLVARVIASKAEGFARRVVFALTLCGSYAFAGCWLPHLPFHTQSLEGTNALVCQALSVAAAIEATVILFYAPFRRNRLTLALVVLTLALAIMLTSIAGLLRGAPAEWPTRPNVILISLDTLRTDHLSCYGYERETTPRIDRFAAQGIRFTRAHAPHPWTLTSHMSMMTGLLPTEHGVEGNRRLSSSLPTLAELYEEAGYNTLALIDPVVWLDKRYGFDRGFSSYRRIYGSAEEKIAMLETVFDDLQGEPFFLFLHYFDAHSDNSKLPYDSSNEEFKELCDWYTGDFAGCDTGGRCASEFLQAVNRNQATVDADTERYIVDLYDAGIATMDRRLGQLFDQLEEHGLYENSIVVLTSDHGEEFREHGLFLHGTHFQECVSVPLIVRTPGRIDPSTTERLVSHVDLASTLLQLCGIESSRVGGRSFAPLIARGIDTKRRNPIFFDGQDGALGVRLGDWKLVESRGETFLFDLASDPAEQRNLIDTQPEPKQLAELRALIEIKLRQIREQNEASSNDVQAVDLSEDDLRELKNLGYAGDH